jgi:hypothetical protein
MRLIVLADRLAQLVYFLARQVAQHVLKASPLCFAPACFMTEPSSALQALPANHAPAQT